MADSSETLSTEMEVFETPKRHSRRFAVFAFLVAAALIASALTYRASQWIPPFYQQTLTSNQADLVAYGEDLERELVELHNDIQDKGRWEGVFTDAQINGWLAVDMLEKFPNLLPKSIKEPRVAIKGSEVHIACQYQKGGVSVVLSLVTDINLTERPNEIAVRLCNARIGAVPGFVRKAIPTINRAGYRSGIRIYWQQMEGDPVAIVKIPVDVFEDCHDLVVESVHLAEGRVAVIGRVDVSEPQEVIESPEAVTARDNQSVAKDNRQR